MAPAVAAAAPISRVQTISLEYPGEYLIVNDDHSCLVLGNRMSCTSYRNDAQTWGETSSITFDRLFRKRTQELGLVVSYTSNRPAWYNIAPPLRRLKHMCVFASHSEEEHRERSG